MEVDKKIKEFCHKYDAKAGPTGQVWRRVKRVPLGDYMYNPSVFETYIHYHEIQTVRIEMPEDRFRALLEHEQWVANAGLHENRHFSNNVMRVSELIVEHENECKVRNENPAVKAAYEKYLMLLELARK